MASLKGKRIIVVGGSSGIGLGVAAAALERGAELVIVGRSGEKLRAAERTLGPGGRVRSLSADMTKEADIARIFDETGAFDHLVSTAGTPPPNDPIGQTDMDYVRRFVDNKLIGAVMLAKHGVRTLKAGGSMTFTSGINKDRPPVPGGSVVSAIAGSFGYFARALALELAPTRVNIVSPGWVDTPMWDELVGEGKSGFFAGMAARLPARKVATPADVAPAYLYLMESEFTTGETIRIDGGQNLI
ncbi:MULTISPECIES: SDR family oxidoreductase [unclassified Mesorhizobium]|uniref:SDR family oxidoreductase n=1 Tax=unclassified Mesorhizobium TaxID=325217 RepID=UPI001126843B|nr:MULTISPECIES: SDR family oxidoreductase [unclassified Mesorhizobium]MBZ9921561.1 SDR family oxidoreductase [Mesorhizobium sp. BR1-1-7]MBZ9971855.1 SDR family oxidoreductase [Mesorhizobium sp. BR1-1-12]TPM98810.1 SDR family oxidoreductase [Mesorhizobium sp. B2-1-5]